MYIAPQSNIRILKDVPLDNTYNHTLYWESESDQANYFMSKQKYNLTNQTYQRVNKGTMRVDVVADNLYDCNYLMFQNTGFGNKWFYCFIKSVEYINNEVSEISYELDSMQTWHFNYQLEQCYVEREHSITDNIGDNILPEPLQVGEYVLNGEYGKINEIMTTLATVDLTELAVAVIVVNVEDDTSEGSLYDGIYGSGTIYVFTTENTREIDQLIYSYRDSPDSIIGMYMFPKVMVQPFPNPPDNKLPFRSVARDYTYQGIALSQAATIDGYTPINKKLYTYPYNFFHVDNANGSSLELRYEFFENLQPILQVKGVITQPVELSIRPVNYKNVPSYDATTGYTQLNTESLILSDYPICSWNIDAYQAWVAQNKVPLMNSLVTGGISSLIGMDYGSSKNNPAGQYMVAQGAGNILAQITNAANAIYAASIAADISKGSFNNGNINCAKLMQTFYCGRMSITKDFAKTIDDFFTMFGYACREVKKPLRTTRPHWNYIKTIGCIITGSIPCDEANKICQIYDNGITFWKNPSEVGNYSLDNSPQ